MGVETNTDHRQKWYRNQMQLPCDGIVSSRNWQAQHTKRWRGFSAGCVVVQLHMPVHTVTSKSFGHIQMV